LTLNRAAAEAMNRLEIHSVTDITGFGLLGHAREMAQASGVTIEIEPKNVPIFPGALEYAKAGAIPGGLKNNREFVECSVEGSSDLDDLLYDPQTSGGLLISLPEAAAARYVRKYPAACPIGRVRKRQGKPIRIL